MNRNEKRSESLARIFLRCSSTEQLAQNNLDREFLWLFLLNKNRNENLCETTGGALESAKT